MSSEFYRRVTVIVLGDFGRSPRMQYHTLALAESGANVDVIAYAGTAPIAALRAHPRVRLHLMSAPLAWKKRDLPPVVVIALATARLCKQMLQLLALLALRVRKPDFVLVQNPPAVPTLLVALIAARAYSAKLIVDWHNFGSSMLALHFRQENWLVRMALWYEKTLARRANAHLCVSEAMRSELAESWGIPGAIVLYDRPAAHFAPTPPDVRQDLLCRIGGELDFPYNHDHRPALIVYPTSWTADEDFSLLLEAAIKCDAMIDGHDREADQPFTRLLIVITGRGPLRRHYEKEIARLQLAKVHLRTVWLSQRITP